MFASVDIDKIFAALQSPMRLGELAVVAACFVLGWLLDRRVALKSRSGARRVRVGLGGVNRLLFPITTLVLLVVAGAVFRHWRPPFFLALALPLTIALAVIRLVVYGMREVFGAPAWLPASERAVAFTIWGVVLLYFIGVLPEVAGELQSMEIPIGSHRISVFDIVRATFAMLLTIAITLWLAGLIEQRLMHASSLDNNVRTVLSKAIKAVLLVAALLIALQMAGIDLTLLGVFGGAVGVGIGLGLQKLASNYIAGFTILLDRSIRVGDMITVDTRYGVVTKVTARYVVVRSLDGIEAIVPNETLVITTVLNHSYTSPEVRMAIPVQVSYDTDLDLALRLLEESARAEPRVLKEPLAPAAFIVRFGDSGIDLELGVWIGDPDQGQLNLRSAINRRIWAAFQANRITIPFPQRDLRVVAANSPLPNGVIPEGGIAISPPKSFDPRQGLGGPTVYNPRS